MPVPESIEAPDGSPVAVQVVGPVAQLEIVALGVTVSSAPSATVCAGMASTVTGARSMVTGAALPVLEAIVAFEQSRRTTFVIVTLPVPLPAAFVTCTSNNVPDGAVGPQLDHPRIVPSTVYEPSPWSVTMNDVLGFQLERYVPSVIAGAGEHRVSSGESVRVTLKARRPVVSLREICTGTVAQLWAGVMHAAGEAADTVSV